MADTTTIVDDAEVPAPKRRTARNSYGERYSYWECLKCGTEAINKKRLRVACDCCDCCDP